MLQRTALVVVALALAGCDPRDCWLGISHGDCSWEGPSPTAFPQDDAICQGYGLKPGTRDYATCRGDKHHVRALTRHETDRGVLQGPFLPDFP